MKIETYKHYATGEERRIQIVEEVETQKIGFEKSSNKYVPIICDRENRWQIRNTSFFLIPPKKEELEAFEKEIIKTEQLQKNINHCKERTGNFGRLKAVSRAMKPFVCRECGKEFEKGIAHYNQSDYSNGGLFPVQTKICKDCGQIQIDQGIKLK